MTLTTLDTAAAGHAEGLDDGYYAKSYALRKNASSMTPATLEWLRAHVGPEATAQVRSAAFQRGQPFRVLSVGAGEGDIDVEIARHLLAALRPLGVPLEYVLMEPNKTHRATLGHRMGEVAAEGGMAVEVLGTRFEEASFEHKFNLVFMIQVLYYFQDKTATMEAAVRDVLPMGKVIIVHQCYRGVPQIQTALMRRLKGTEAEKYTCQDISLDLDRVNIPFGYTHLPAALDLTPCLRRSTDGDMIMSFCLECKVETAGPRLYEETLQQFWAKAEVQDDGRSLLDEPIGVFVIPGYSALDHDCELDSLSDIKDYSQLAISVDWSRWFAPLAATGGRILEVGCGTGRWQSAFSRLVGPQLGVDEQNAMLYDLVDPSTVAIKAAVGAMRHPFTVGNEFPMFVQDAPLDRAAYDVAWSMHAFYAIPRRDLADVVTKIHQSLKPSTGVAVIGQPDAGAFYISLFKLVIEAYGIDASPFTEFGDITAALDTAGIPWRHESIFYEEIIPVADKAAAQHFVVNECITYSFSRDVASRYADLSLDTLRAHPTVGPFLNGFIQGDCWHFPQSVNVIIFGDGMNAA